jgi:hypothetical protein
MAHFSSRVAAEIIGASAKALKKAKLVENFMFGR